MTTCEVAKRLGVTPERVRNVIRFERIRPLPQKDSLGHYVWTGRDVKRARAVLAPEGARSLERGESRFNGRPLRLGAAG